MNNNTYHKTTELISKFKNGDELYKRSPMFNTAIQMMAEGMTIYDVFEQLVLENERRNRAFENYIMRDTRPLSTEL